DQGFDQVWRHLLKLDEGAVFVVRRVQATHQQRLQTRNGQIGAVDTTQARHLITAETHPYTLGRFRPLVELETTGMQLYLAASHRRHTRTANGAFPAITERIQFPEKIFLG